MPAHPGPPPLPPVSTDRMSRLGFGTILLGFLLVLALAGFVMLTIIDVPPPTRSIEIQIPHDRFSR